MVLLVSTHHCSFLQLERKVSKRKTIGNQEENRVVKRELSLTR